MAAVVDVGVGVEVEKAGTGALAPGERRELRRRTVVGCLAAALSAAAAIRLVNIGALGFNSDEAVYAGQSASLAGNPHYVEEFPVFRAHPMLVQSLLSLVYRQGEHDIAGRVVVAMLGVATVAVVYLLGRELYSQRVGLLAAGLLALMPYHVVVTRQVLLDGPMVFFASLTLFCLARWGRTQRVAWFVAAGGSLGLTMLAKESSIVLIAGVYAFLALSPSLRVPVLGIVGALVLTIGIFLVHPVSIALAGHVGTGKSYLVWQLLRRPNHGWGFYAETVPWAIGPLVLGAALLALWRVRGVSAWREVLLGAWIVAPVAAFEVWPVKGFQYLLPVVPAVAVLAAQGVFRLRTPAWAVRRADPRPDAAVDTAGLQAVVAALILLSLLLVSVSHVRRTDATQLLAGTGGLPGGREAGRWIGAHTPEGATLLTVGPSMANVVQYYGHRPAFGLSVSPNPLHRNPSYTPIVNPDKQMRHGDLQYAVWDAFSAARSPHFSEQLLNLARRYHGRAVHTEYVTGRDRSGRPAKVPVIIVYEVRP
jgi:hypothetical protein